MILNITFFKFSECNDSMLCHFKIYIKIYPLALRNMLQLNIQCSICVYISASEIICASIFELFLSRTINGKLTGSNVSWNYYVAKSGGLMNSNALNQTAPLNRPLLDTSWASARIIVNDFHENFISLARWTILRKSLIILQYYGLDNATVLHCC